MRLFLVPVSTRRTLLYAQRLAPDPTRQTGSTTTTTALTRLLDRGTALAARTWAGWERKEGGWQRKVVDYGNHALRRVAFEEWGLKSVSSLIPSSSSSRQGEGEGEGTGGDAVEVVFPSEVIAAGEVSRVAWRLATERQGLHRRQMMWCFVGMPITAPLAIIPIIPNLPFFYLAYRAFSNWRAISGGEHVQRLVERQLLRPSPSRALDLVYAQSPAARKYRVAVSSSSTSSQSSSAAKEREGEVVVEEEGEEEEEEEEQILLTPAQMRGCADALAAPELESELERAVWQIEQELARKKQDGTASR